MNIGDKRRKQELFRLVPEWVTSFAFSSRVGHEGCHQLQNILFRVDIVEGVVVHRLLEIDGVEYFYAIIFLQKCVSDFKNRSTFRVCQNVGTVHLQKIRLNEISSLTTAGAAHNEYIFIARRFGVFGAAGHGEALGLGQNDVILKLGVYIRLNIFGIAPTSRPILAAVAVFFGIFASKIHSKPQASTAEQANA